MTDNIRQGFLVTTNTHIEQQRIQHYIGRWGASSPCSHQNVYTICGNETFLELRDDSDLEIFLLC